MMDSADVVSIDYYRRLFICDEFDGGPAVL